LFAAADGNLRGRVTYETLLNVLEHFKDSNWPADHVQVTGDLIQDGTPGAYQRFCNTMATVGLPVYCVPGNHDIRDIMREALQAKPFHYCGTLQTGNWLIAGVDSCMEGSAAGHIDDHELNRLGLLIETTGAAHVMVCLHHPPLPVGSRWLDELILQNREQFLERITGSPKVKLVVSGHVHQEFDGNYRSVRIIGTPSTCRQFALRSDSYALDDKPPAYRRLELRADGHVDTELVWI
jgi:3',5'-cyclic-AMP phosphodiesterase